MATKAKKNKGGQHSPYCKAYVDKAQSYLDNWEATGDAVPMITGLAIELDLSRETVYAWCKDPKKKPFSDIVSKIRASQRRTLMSKGLSGEHNAKITQLLLSHTHQVIEKRDVQKVEMEVSTAQMTDAQLMEIALGK